MAVALGDAGVGKTRPGSTEVRAGAQPSPRELQVAGLVAKGLTDREIAAVLWVSPRTVETHVRNIMRKPLLTSRAEIAAWING